MIDEALSIQERLYRRQFKTEDELLGSLEVLFDVQRFLTTSIQDRLS